jgi:hypothetical protein
MGLLRVCQMLEWLHYRYHLARLQREKSKTQHRYAPIYQGFRDEKPMGLASPGLYYLQEQQEIAIIDDNITQLTSEYLVSRAERYQLLVPQIDRKDGKWESSSVTGRYRLTQAAILELRSAIRAEEKERSELTRSWLASIAPIIGALTGLVGVLIGLLTLLWRHKTGLGGV